MSTPKTEKLPEVQPTSINTVGEAHRLVYRLRAGCVIQIIFQGMTCNAKVIFPNPHDCNGQVVLETSPGVWELPETVALRIRNRQLRTDENTALGAIREGLIAVLEAQDSERRPEKPPPRVIETDFLRAGRRLAELLERQINWSPEITYGTHLTWLCITLVKSKDAELYVTGGTPDALTYSIDTILSKLSDRPQRICNQQGNNILLTGKYPAKLVRFLGFLRGSGCDEDFYEEHLQRDAEFSIDFICTNPSKHPGVSPKVLRLIINIGWKP